MKIQNIAPAAVQASVTARAASGSGSAEQVDPQDKVTVPSAQESAAHRAVQAAVASGRAQRIEEVISAVKSGQYYPTPQQIANQLVSSAEISAQIASLVKP